MDKTGGVYKPLQAEEAFNHIMAGVASTEPTLATKTLKGISFGKAGNKVTVEQVKEDIGRYGLQSEDIAARSVKDGLIYFDPPQKKKFTIEVTLGDLWPRPFTFSTTKPR